jgi:CMP-N-acetylneuraminic acid synthetase
VVVSTDDHDIADVARGLGAEVPFLRPARLAADDTPMLDVLVDLVATLAEREGYRPDLLVLLQPTSPFRRPEHIDAAVDLLVSSRADSVVTVVPVPHQFSPSSVLRLEGDRLVPWMPGPSPSRRQDKPVLFARNGPAVVAVRTPVVTDARSLYGADTRGLVMTRAESFDIDDMFDLHLAELLMGSRRA